MFKGGVMSVCKENEQLIEVVLKDGVSLEYKVKTRNNQTEIISERWY